jgi:hypothetical protein
LTRTRSGFATGTRALKLVVLAVASVWLGGCLGGGSSRESFPAGTESPMPAIPPGTLFVERDLEVQQLAAGGGYVVWTRKFEDVALAELQQLDVRTRAVETLARGDIAQFGLASTNDWVIYALQRESTRLVARSHDGERFIVLSRHLVGPFDARGGLVAWPEADGARYRIVVHEMASGRDWLAAVLPRCESGKCYRIDAVALSTQGVCFVRGAIGQQPSQIGRRSFDGAEQRTPVPDDPQPDLIRSSNGPLFIAEGKRLLTWPFGARTPRPAPAAVRDPQQTVLGHEWGWWFLVSADRVGGGVYAQRTFDSRVQLAKPPSRSPAYRGAPALEAFAWSGRQAFSAWALSSEGGEIATSIIRADATLPSG